MKKSIFCLLIVLLTGCQISMSDTVSSFDGVYEKKNIDLENGYVFGNKEASVVVIEYASVNYTYCIDLHTEINEELKNFIEGGEIFYI